LHKNPIWNAYSDMPFTCRFYAVDALGYTRATMIEAKSGGGLILAGGVKSHRRGGPRPGSAELGNHGEARSCCELSLVIIAHEIGISSERSSTHCADSVPALWCVYEELFLFWN